MPAILNPDDAATWIGEGGASDKQLKSLLHTYSGTLAMRPQEPNAPKTERNTTKARPKSRRKNQDRRCSRFRGLLSAARRRCVDVERCLELATPPLPE